MFYKFSAKNTSWSTFSGFSWARAGVLTCPALLNSLSDGELVAGIARYRLTSFRPNIVSGFLRLVNARRLSLTFFGTGTGKTSFSWSWTGVARKTAFFRSSTVTLSSCVNAFSSLFVSTAKKSVLYLGSKKDARSPSKDRYNVIWAFSRLPL